MVEGLTINQARSVHQLVIHLYNAKQPLLQHLHGGIPPLDGQTLPESRQKIRIWGMKPANISGCKSMVEGLTIMLRVFINLLYTCKMPNNHYCSTCMMAYPHLMAKHCLEVGRKSGSDAWNRPTSGCKSMVEGLTIMLRVFINLLYIHTKPNNHYCSTYMMAYPHLMAQHCLKVGRKSGSEAWNRPTSGCKSMVEGLTIMLRVFITLLCIHTMPNNHYYSVFMMAYPHLMAKHCLEVGRKSWFLPDLRHETRQHKWL